MKTQYFNGVRFTRDDKTGYYLNSTMRKRIHRYVWESYNGEIPKGYEIHHIDHDKSNNSIENLELMTFANHQSYHAAIRGKKNVETGHLDNIRPLTKEWHASEEGKKWHREHYENNKHLLHVEKEFECEMCEKKYKTTATGNNRFCSNKCKSKWRRESGVDDEIRECVNCGRHFAANKYTKTKACSKSCAASQRHKKRKSEVN